MEIYRIEDQSGQGPYRNDRIYSALWVDDWEVHNGNTHPSPRMDIPQCAWWDPDHTPLATQ